MDDTPATSFPRASGAQTMPGLVWAFRMHADGTPQSLPVDKPIDINDDGWLWLHFNLADARACALLPRFEDIRRKPRLPSPRPTVPSSCMSKTPASTEFLPT